MTTITPQTAFLLGMLFQVTIGAFITGFIDALIEDLTGFSYQKYIKNTLEPK